MQALEGPKERQVVESHPHHQNERVWNLEWGENMYLGWYLVRKECGKSYLDIGFGY